MADWQSQLEALVQEPQLWALLLEQERVGEEQRFPLGVAPDLQQADSLAPLQLVGLVVEHQPSVLLSALLVVVQCQQWPLQAVPAVAQVGSPLLVVKRGPGPVEQVERVEEGSFGPVAAAAVVVVLSHPRTFAHRSFDFFVDQKCPWWNSAFSYLQTDETSTR